MAPMLYLGMEPHKDSNAGILSFRLAVAFHALVRKYLKHKLFSFWPSYS